MGPREARFPCHALVLLGKTSIRLHNTFRLLILKEEESRLNSSGTFLAAPARPGVGDPATPSFARQPLPAVSRESTLRAARAGTDPAHPR